MKALVLPVVILLCFNPSESTKEAPPKVQVYSHAPGRPGIANSLVCHASSFYPPDIKIELLKGGQEIPGANQTDLAFHENWNYHLTRHVAFTPQEGASYSCRVTFQGETKHYIWDPDM